MKTAIAITMLASLTLAIGCGSERGGGMSGGEGFRIITPILGAKIKQGDSESLTIALNRGEYFKRDVTLEIRASNGINVEPTKAVVKGNDKPEVVIRVSVPKDANLGEYKIFVTGTPETGESTSAEFTVKVVAP